MSGTQHVEALYKEGKEDKTGKTNKQDKASKKDKSIEQMTSYSQFGQDVEIAKFYKNKRDGFFLEIGASDGKELSNTYLLETKYGWKGICIEPIPYRFADLVRNRPRSKCVDYAVFHTSGLEVVFAIANNGDGLSGIQETIDCHKALVDANKTEIVVKTITLGDLLAGNGAPTFVEYLSLDTEGSEYEILKGFDFSTYRFGRIDVEHNFVEPRRTQIRELLTSNGYTFLRENHVDDCYADTSRLLKSCLLKSRLLKSRLLKSKLLK